MEGWTGENKWIQNISGFLVDLFLYLALETKRLSHSLAAEIVHLILMLKSCQITIFYIIKADFSLVFFFNFMDC